MASRKGRPNKATATREAAHERAGLTPLMYMLRVLRDETAASDDRKWAAQNAAPYVHPRLTSIQGGDTDKPVRHVVEEHIVDHRRREAED